MEPVAVQGRAARLRRRLRADGAGSFPLSIGTISIRAWLAIVLTVVVIGTAGYVVILGWPADDALYMTVITLTTVGFREVRPLDDAGRIWTSLLSISGVAIIFGTIGIVVESFVRDLASGRREEKRMAETLASLHDHIVLCGYGRVGSTVARELVNRDIRVVVIDILSTSIERARRDGHLVLEGDATEDRTLLEAGIKRARGLVTTIDSDANNVYVVLSARALQPELFILGRANAEGSEAKLLQAGANRVVSPYTMAGRRFAELAIRPRVADFIDLALSSGEHAFTLEEVEVEAASPLEGRRVGDLRKEGVFTLAIVSKSGRYEANPADERALAAGESLVLSGAAATLEAFRHRI